MLPVTPPARRRFGVFEVHPASGELRKQGRRIRLAEQPFQILLALLERPGEVVTRQQLRQRLWPDDTFVDFDANLNTAISLLRDALGDSAKSPRFIETLPRRGYRFLGDVEQVGAAPPEAPNKKPGRRPVIVAAAGLVLIGASVLAGLTYRSRSAPVIESIAVLPLVYAGPQRDVDQEYLADGLTSALITELARLGVPNVVSETSVMQYKRAPKPLPVIARELGAEMLVEGSVLREGNTVRVNAQLIDARTDSHIWASSYEREMDSILELHAELAAAIVGEMRARLPPSVREASAAVSTKVNARAHEAYLRGRHALNGDTDERRDKAREYFEEAIRLDPAGAPAYAGLAYYYANTDVLPPADAFRLSRQHALKALELDGTLANPHLSLALGSLWGDWNWAAAEREFRRSLDLDPNDAVTRRWYALFLDLMGRSGEAAVQLERVRQLDPVSPDAYYAQAHHLFLARRYADALEQIGRVEELNPQSTKVFEAQAMLHAASGAHAESIAASERGIAIWGREPLFIVPLALAHARAGERDTARTLLVELETAARRRHIPPCWFALVRLHLGQFDLTFEWLERAYLARDVYLVHLRTSPLYDAIRSDPRFQSLLGRMNFPPLEGT